MKPDTTPKPVIYTTEKGLPKGGRYANPQYFDAIKQDAPKVIIVGNWPAVAEAYRRVGIPVEYAGTALDTAAMGMVRHNTPADRAADPNAPLTAIKGPGGRWFVKRGNEIVTGPFETEADAKKAAGIEGGKIELGIGTDSGEQFSDAQLASAIEGATGKRPHHRTGRERLVQKFNELNAA